MYRLIAQVILAATLALLAHPTFAESATLVKGEITVAAAADLKFALDELVQDFKKTRPGVEVKVTYGSSGNFFAQLSNKAPFDIFFSADIEYPRKLIANGQGLKETEFQYAVGQIVVWTPATAKLDVAKKGMEALKDPTVKKIAIANPAHAPYGRAAEAAMKSLGVYDQVKSRLVLGENIAQAAQFVESGAADVGIIAMSLAESPVMKEKGTYWTVPLDSYPRLIQGGVIMPWTKNLAAASALRAHVLSDAGKAVLKRYGFLQPSA